MITDVGRYRRFYDYTQDEMAELLGVSKVTYGNKERGHIEFKASEMFTISKEFGVPMDKIFKLDKELKR